MNKITLFSAFLCAHFLTLWVVHGGETLSPCIHTPYPELCSSFMSLKPQGTIEKNPFAVRESALRFTLSQAHEAHRLISAMDVRSFDKLAKLAWADCLELYEDTVDNLNRSMGSGNANDVQTWLSAAITNQKTCENGFVDFQLSSHLKAFPSMLSNFTKFLSNSLAINKAVVLPTSVNTNGKLSGEQHRNRRLLAQEFPEWVSAGNRRLLQSPAPRANVVVAQDGSGNYKTISEAVAASAKRRSATGRFIIYVKRGVYKENVEIKKTMKNLMFIGDGIDATIVTGSKSAEGGSTTFRSATFAVSGSGFIARGMTFENTAGPQKHQAVAFRSGSDLSVMYSCSFKGYQDTLYVYSQRQFYRNCDVYGTIDFIFGDAVAVLQNCNIYSRKSNQRNTVTAQGRSNQNQNTGIVIHNSRISCASKTYLGRPWKAYSRTVIMKTSLDGMIDPAGWLPWSGNFALKTLYYGEYMNTGSGASTGGRVKWPGYHVITNAGEAGKFSVGSFLAGSSWIPATGVPFTSGL